MLDQDSMLNHQMPERYPVKLEIEQVELGGMFTITLTDNQGHQTVVHRGMITMRDDPETKAKSSFVSFALNVLKAVWMDQSMIKGAACSCDEHGHPCVDIVDGEPVYAAPPQVIPIHQVQRYRMQ